MRLHVEVSENGKVLFTGEFSEFPIVFGRASHCNVSLPQVRYLASMHFVIIQESGAFAITDLNSPTGLLAENGQTFVRAQFTESGTILIPGGLEIRVKRLESPAGESDPDSDLEENYDSTDAYTYTVTETALDRTVPSFTAPPIFQAPPEMDVRSVSTPGSTAASVAASAVAAESVAEVVAPAIPVPQPLPPPPQPPPQAQPLPPPPPRPQLKVVPPVPQSPNIRNRLARIAHKLKIERRPYEGVDRRKATLEGVLVWGEDILDVRQFRTGDTIYIAGDIDAPIYLPGIKKPIVLGHVDKTAGHIGIAQNVDWHLQRNGVDFTAKDAVDQQVVANSGAHQKFKLQLGDLFTADLGNNVALHLRYVERSRFFIRRTWIENREEFVKAFQASALVHFALLLILAFSASPVNAPKVEDVPPRFAKLLVEPPKMPLAPPPPLPPPPPPEPVVEKPPEPKPEPKPKPLPKKKPIVAKKRPKTAPRKEAKARPPREPVREVVEAPPQPTEAEIAAAKLQEALSDIAAPPSAGSNQAIKIAKNTSPGISGDPSLTTMGVSGALKSKGGKLKTGFGQPGAGGTSTKVGQLGYSNTPGGSKAGKRGVGGVVVGTPALKNYEGTSNGLTDKQIMSVVNKYLTQIHRCYERALLNDASLAGRVEYEWEITPSGKVSATRVKRSEVSNGDMLNSCVMGVFKSMKFPAAKNKQPTTASIGFPFGKES
ncbi:MAG: AgmX/PglI C-terminal domain-containing protein [Bdellovibrionales bacterium]